MHEADKPDLVSDFSDAAILASGYRTQIDLAVANANPATLCDPDCQIMKRVLRDDLLQALT